MGNTSSHPLRRPSPAPAPPPPPATRTRPLKRNKRSIVDHPQLLLNQSPAPSSPIPIPTHPGHPPPPRPPPANNDSSDVVPELISHNGRDDPTQHTHRPLPHNSTRSFGGVRRGGVQGGGWAPDDSDAPSAPMEDIVRSSIPLRIPQAYPPNDPRSAVARQKEAAVAAAADPDGDADDENEGLVPTQIVWRGGGKEVLLAGTFHELEWRARSRMRFDPTTSTHALTLYLPPGTYRLKFIVDDTWRCSDDMPTATDDETGNLVNYIDVEDSSALDLAPGSEERQGRDARVMKANRRRTYPRPRAPNSRSPTTTRPVHPPLLLPSESAFWGAPDADADAERALAGWERGRDGVLEKWTSVVPEGLVVAAQEEEAYHIAVQAQREARRGGAGTRGTLGALGMGVPSIPSPPRLPRHLDKVILNTKSSSSSAAGSASGRSSRSGKHKSRAPLGMTSLLAPDTSAGAGLEKSASAAAMEQWAQADDSSVLPVPSHVVLHHLGTSAIKNGVLAVSDTTRYNKKYITTIFYKPT